MLLASVISCNLCFSDPLLQPAKITWAWYNIGLLYWCAGVMGPWSLIWTGVTVPHSTMTATLWFTITDFFPGVSSYLRFARITRKGGARTTCNPGYVGQMLHPMLLVHFNSTAELFPMSIRHEFLMVAHYNVSHWVSGSIPTTWLDLLLDTCFFLCHKCTSPHIFCIHSKCRRYE